MKTSLADFVQQHSEKTQHAGLFELESERVLEVNLGMPAGQGAGSTPTMVWMKVGAMVAYSGSIRFTREGMLEQGLGNLLKKAVSGEGASLSKAEGQGKLYVADGGKRLTILQLQGESVFVNGNDLIVMEATLTKEITMQRKLSAIASGGLFSVRVGGRGMLVIGTHGAPLVLRVRPGVPVFTDPQATVLWSGNLSPEFKTDVSVRTFLGRGSGESFQMQFTAQSGEGFVVVQPYEEVMMQAGG
jgi:uncharacterized protein (AIM24 family)